MVEHHIDVLMGLVDKVAVMYFGSDHRLRHPAERHGRPDRAERLPRDGGRMSTDGSSRCAACAARSPGSRSSRTSRFDVPATGITAVLGRNGVGKTSTLRGILGLIHRRGEVTLAGERIDGLTTHRIVQRGVGYVPEDREIFSKLTVAENLALAERQKSAAPRVRRRAVPRSRAAPRPARRHALGRAAADGLGRPGAAQRQPAAPRRRAHEGPRAEDRRPRSPTPCSRRPRSCRSCSSSRTSRSCAASPTARS